MMDTRSIQTLLARARFLKQSDIDGVSGKGTRAAGLAAIRALGVNASLWPRDRQDAAIGQWALRAAGFDPGMIDGRVGSDTKLALERWQNASRDKSVRAPEIAHLPTASSVWPRQRDMAKFYGAPGTGHVLMPLPYPMVLAWDPDTEVNRITIHGKCAASATRVFTRVLEHYGMDAIRAQNLDRFGGCFAHRPMRGGSQLSTHAFACALDLDPENNQLRWGRDRAHMARPENQFFVDAWRAEGWVSLGVERNFDWMHFQAARF